jgi:hypothetical protein
MKKRCTYDNTRAEIAYAVLLPRRNLYLRKSVGNSVTSSQTAKTAYISHRPCRLEVNLYQRCNGNACEGVFRCNESVQPLIPASYSRTAGKYLRDQVRFKRQARYMKSTNVYRLQSNPANSSKRRIVFSVEFTDTASDSLWYRQP